MLKEVLLRSLHLTCKGIDEIQHPQVVIENLCIPINKSSRYSLLHQTNQVHLPSLFMST